jgi:hypothetical protein
VGGQQQRGVGGEAEGAADRVELDGDDGGVGGDAEGAAEADAAAEEAGVAG